MSSDPDSHIWGQLIVLVVCLVLSLLFATLAFLMTNVSTQRLDEDAKAGDNKATRVLKLLQRQASVLVALRTFTLSAELVAGLMVFNLIQVWLPLNGIGTLIVWLVVFVITVLFLQIFANLLPQQLALNHPEQQAKRYSGLILSLQRLLQPWSWLLLLLTRGWAHLFGLPFHNEVKRELSREEMIEMIEHGQKSGAIEADEFQMFEGIIDMQDKMAREVMVPRTDAFMLNIEDDDATNIKLILEQNYSRIPIYRSDKDKVIGVVHIKNLLQRAHQVGFEHVKIIDVMQEPLFVPETIMIDRLLYEFKKTQNQLSILLDEYGGLVGLVSIEDLLEEIVGEIDDESDEAEVLYRQLDPHHYVVKGNMPLDDFNELFATDIDSPDVDTIAGYTLAELGTIPDLSEQLTLTLANDLELQTGAMEGSRLLEVIVTLPEDKKVTTED
ncbi:hemolysin family protein [Loigolactobacillus jiayinensis]|uniref:Hemolysin family protein n=1 Tax=Loigolactobacillus jiayinensis TaxID=2486016 RepID=A0ABW1R8C9_9LACO|nr:hemolysin family protein [Loigolactobacillus jiayinensis]